MIFSGLEFKTSPAVMPPYPVTEKLVDHVDQFVDLNNKIFCDVGTGSGNIAITLVKRFTTSHCTAIDISNDALALAAENAHFHGVQDRIELKLCAARDLSGQFDLIITNLPYLSAARAESFTLKSAVTDGGDGLSILRDLIEIAPRRLKPGGVLLLEYTELDIERVIALFDRRWQVKVLGKKKVSEYRLL